MPEPAPAALKSSHKVVPETPRVNLPADAADAAAMRIKTQLMQSPGALAKTDAQTLLAASTLMLLRLHEGTETDGAALKRLVTAAPSMLRGTADTDSLKTLLDRYETTGDNALLAQAEKAADAIVPGTAAPHAASLAINLNRLYFYTGNPAYRKTAESILQPLSANIKTAPLGDAAATAYAIELVRGFPLEMVVLGSRSHPQFKKLLAAANSFDEPRKVILALDPADPTDKKRLDSLPYTPRPEPTLFACVEVACAMPLSDPALVGKRMKLFTDKFLNKTSGGEKGKL